MKNRPFWLVLSLAVSLWTSPAAQLSAQIPGQLTAAKTIPPPTDPAQAADQPILATDLICVVGGDRILAGDVFAYIEPIIEENRKSIPPGQEDMVRRQLMRKMLSQYVQVKAMYQDFISDVVGQAAPSEAKEMRKKVLVKANRIFYEKQVPNLLKSNNVNNVLALEEKLREKSLSLNQLKQQFVERVLASEAERKNVPEEVEILPDELIEYYQAHLDQWQRMGRARWRQLTARFDRYPTKAEARAAIDTMGNEVYLGGKPFEAVAKASSQGFTAKDGGVHDWTTQGALKSKPLDTAIFFIEPKRLSQVIEDEVGFHIIEVLERENARTITFDEAHDQIREALLEKKRKELSDAYHKKVMDRTVVWTRWPEDIPGSRSLAEALAE